MSKYGPEYAALRERVLVEEPACVGYPLGVHEGEIVRTTEADHIVPVSRGGVTNRAQLRGMCRSCNRRKGLDERVRTWRDR